MRILLTPFIVAYRIYFATVFFVVLTLFYPVFWILLLNEKNNGRVFKLKTLVSAIILFLDFIYIRRLTKPKLKGPYVICPNHSSYLDIILMYRILPHTRFLFMGKSELLRWPILSIFFRKVDIAVNREKRFSAMKSILRARQELNKGWSIVIFPEGKIPVDAPKLDHFKSGSFKLAIDAQVPILPITIIDNWKLFYTDPVLTGLARPGFARVIIHDEIDTKGMTKKDLVNLRHRTFETINTPLLKYNRQAYKNH
ncbi:MAG: 1-acyl-sn-glycerol-3-phosphate acyltransferase [Crocinitomicaceae bacterium]|nr:1-acyl-sn-glycerol-3-phosphate acyltransferase [Crocinitomicaceae bacterium]MBK8927682.1 1-acyl-sn-glycerol-3-phosphate acyltransferase [Crocinitomicaceae bacterium]